MTEPKVRLYHIENTIYDGVRRAIDVLIQNGFTESEVRDRLFLINEIISQAIKKKFHGEARPDE